MSLLVVDDSLTIRAMIAQVLGRDPAIEIVALASNAEEAEAVIRSRHVDVVTLDIAMPGQNGLDYLQDLMKHHPIPVVMLSSQTARHAPDRQEALDLGAVACFDKARILTDAAGLARMVHSAARSRPKLRTKRKHRQAAAAAS